MKFAGVFVLAAMTGAMWAQGPRVGFGKSVSWWEGPLAADLNLSDSQVRQLRSTVSQFRVRLAELRANVNRAERDVQTAFNDDPVDQGRANDAIEQLVNARGELFRATSQMDLKLRTVLTAEQWQELQERQRQPLMPPGGRRRQKGAPQAVPSGAKVTQSTAPPATSIQK